MANTVSDCLYYLQPKMEKPYTVNKNKTRSWLWLRSWTLTAKFRLKLEKVGKTTRSFRYDLNRLPYYYTVEVTNRFKGLDLIDKVPEELQLEVHNTVQQVVIKTIPKEKEMWEGKIVLRRPYKRLRKKRNEIQSRKGRIYPTECRLSKNSWER